MLFNRNDANIGRESQNPSILLNRNDANIGRESQNPNIAKRVVAIVQKRLAANYCKGRDKLIENRKRSLG